MIVVYGTRMGGKIKACGTSYVGTLFMHIYYIPLIPLGSRLVLSDGTALPAPFSGKSVFAGYLRTWGPIAVIAAVAIGLGAIGDFEDEPMAMAVVGAFTGVVTLALLIGTILAYAVIGKLSATEKRQRAVYAQHIGYHVDPADMGEAQRSMRDPLVATIAQRALGLASMGYRMNADPSVAWPHIALDPTHNDEGLVTAAFTLARVDASFATGAQKLQLEQLHQHLWQRIERSNFACLQHVAA